MSYNQHNAGIHLVPIGYKTKYDDIEQDSKYRIMMREAEEDPEYRKRKLIKEIELCNFIFLLEKRGTRKNCLCGSKLNYKENIKIKFRCHGKMETIFVTGKQCVDCERKFVVKKEILTEIMSK